MTLTPDELHELHDIAGDLRRSDPLLYNALTSGDQGRSRRSVWFIVYAAASILMLTLGAVAGASFGSVLLWLCLVFAGSVAVRAQDRASINR
jgi:fatty acid desaturase